MLKKVNIMCHRPFKCRYAMFSGRILGAVLDTKIIQFALENKAKVEEVLKGGKTVPLGFNNFDTYNGEPDINEKDIDITDERAYKKPPVETIGKVNRYEEAGYDRGVVLNSTRRGMGLEVLLDNKIKQTEDEEKFKKEVKEAQNKVETIDKKPKTVQAPVAPKFSSTSIEGSLELKDEMLVKDETETVEEKDKSNKGYKKGYKR